MKKGVIESILVPKEGTYYAHTSPHGTIWVRTILDLYNYYKDKNKEKAELLLDILKFCPEADVKEES